MSDTGVLLKLILSTGWPSSDDRSDIWVLLRAYPNTSLPVGTRRAF